MAVLKFKFVPAIRCNLFVSPCHVELLQTKRIFAAIGFKNAGYYKKLRLQGAVRYTLLSLVFQP